MIILASASPRRHELLSRMGYEFTVKISNIEEVFPPDGSISDKIKKVALDKAKSIIVENEDDVIIAADTIVVHDGILLGKPKDYSDAFNTLKKLNDDKHSVITAVAIIYKDVEISFHQESFVYFKNNTDEDIMKYLDTGEPFDKAGSYAIQGIGECLVDRYEGDLDNIIGLPCDKLLTELKKINV